VGASLTKQLLSANDTGSQLNDYLPSYLHFPKVPITRYFQHQTPSTDGTTALDIFGASVKGD